MSIEARLWTEEIPCSSTGPEKYGPGPNSPRVCAMAATFWGNISVLLGTREIHVLNIELDKEKIRRGHHKVCVLDGLVVGWIDLTEYLLASTYDEFIDSVKPHFLQEKRETPLAYVIHHRLAIPAGHKVTDVPNLELDKPKIKHSSRVALRKTLCWPLGEQMWIPTEVPETIVSGTRNALNVIA
ncbi:hypothetical protein AVEN_34914-1 [Araneus ventricosus]|uniref:Uncharacterized protein n=1 Tax=Araneus ventricosus TaxID=182803 RepID=A0A4Y2S0Z5_ARAVE|nr:hypothetical protein AVEN_34914-1 [Araneus ventricosus]